MILLVAVFLNFEAAKKSPLNSISVLILPFLPLQMVVKS